MDEMREYPVDSNNAEGLSEWMAEIRQRVSTVKAIVNSQGVDKRKNIWARLFG